MEKDPKTDQGKSERQESKIKIRFASPEALEKEYSSNISKGGMFINTRKKHPLRSRVIFNFILPDSDQSIELTGEVVHVIEAQPGMDPAAAGIGVQFIDLTPEKRKTIENYLSHLGRADEFSEEDFVSEEDQAREQERQEILKDAIREASRQMQELPPEQLMELKRKIKLFYAKRAEKNHYDLLGIRYTAAPEAIKDAYHKLSMDFHPDRHHRRLPPELRPQIEDIFGRINRSYKTLRDFKSRLEYDVSVGNWGSVPDIPELSEEAKRLFKRHSQYIKKFPDKVERAVEIMGEAQAALSVDDRQKAISQLKLAYSFDPFNTTIIRLLKELGVEVKPPAEG